jgi:hypothetical protein
MRVLASTVALALLNPCLAVSVSDSPAPIYFRDAAREVGVTTVPHFSPEKRYLVEMMGGGVGLFDCDNDGKLDIIAATDSTIERFLGGGDLMVTLYHQDANLHFRDITGASGLTIRGWGMGVAVGDFDGDGLADVYVTGFGANMLYRNHGNCRFENATEKARVKAGGFSVGAAWVDYDRDGNLDLFVSRYVNSDARHLPRPGDQSFNYRGLPIEVPTGNGQTDLLFRNRGNGTFEEVGERAGVNNPQKQLGMGVVWCDYDNDGWPDLFVANDIGSNFLYRNGHDGTFEEVGLLSGIALSVDGQPSGNMGADFGDFDHDGSLDLIVSRYGYQPLSLYRNQLKRGFRDITWDSKIGRLRYQPVRWGVGFADFDNDGWPDIFVANGNVSSLIDELPNELRFREPIQLFRNQGDSTAEEIANVAGLNDGAQQSRRGIAFGDLNNDGNIDVVVYNVGAPLSVFLNETHNNNHRVLLRLEGGKSNRFALGARVKLQTATMTQMGEVRGGSGYLSSNDTRLHFGLRAEKIVSTVEIDWPSGSKEFLHNLEADAIYTVVEGKGVSSTMPISGPQPR